MENNESNEKINRYKKNRKKNSKIKTLFKIIIFIIILMLIAIFSLKLADKYIPNFDEVSIRSIFPQWRDNGIVILLEDTPIATNYPTVEQNGEIYLPVEFVKEYVDKYIFWEPSGKKLTITTENKVIKMKTDDLTAYVNNQILKLDVPIEMINNTAYMPKALLESLYNITITHSSNTNIGMIDYTDRAKTMGTIISKKSSVRSEPSIKEPIVTKLVLNDEVRIYLQTDEWTKIRTETGIVGYISNKDIGNITEIPPKENEIIIKNEIWKPANGKINMVWDLVTTVGASADSNRIKTQKGLDVLSPTWFALADTKGNIENIANKTYVDWAHQQGYQVWALFGNKFDGQFNGKLTHELLIDTDARENMIKQLLALTAMYDLDGINIDFESVLAEDGDYFLQFIRELTPLLKQQGVIVSVDVYVPRPWTQHYQRDELAKIVDYIAIMAYDEHWGTSKVSGSVASIGWVEDGIIASLEAEQIPPEKLLLGIPYYCRLWAETPTADGGVKVTSKAYGIEVAKKIFKDKNIEPIWNEEAGQYYGEYEEKDVTYKIWLEEERSIQEKLKLVDKYNLAGIAGWQRIFTNDTIWDVLYENLK